MIFYKLDYVIEMEQAGRRNAAQCALYATRAASIQSGTLKDKLRRLAQRLGDMFLLHQSWKAFDGVFMATPAEFGQASEQAVAPRTKNHARVLRKLAGVKLSATEAEAIWPRILDHKWYLGERLGRDVGLRVAVVDFFENIQPPRPSVSYRFEWEPLPRLPMMMSLGERL